MVRRIIVIAGGAAALAILLYAAVLYTGRIAPRSVEAGLGGTACPTAPPGTGATAYWVTAVLPVGPNADGICIDLAGTGGQNQGPVVVLNQPAACPAAVAKDAQVSKVWADWGAAACIAPGGLVRLRFLSAGTVALGVQVNAATWHLAGGGTVLGDVTVANAGPSVGGVSESPDAASLAAAANSGSSTNYMPYVGGGIGAAVLVALVAGGGWYVRRRQRA